MSSSYIPERWYERLTTALRWLCIAWLDLADHPIKYSNSNHCSSSSSRSIEKHYPIREARVPFFVVGRYVDRYLPIRPSRKWQKIPNQDFDTHLCMPKEARHTFLTKVPSTMVSVPIRISNTRAICWLPFSELRDRVNTEMEEHLMVSYRNRQDPKKVNFLKIQFMNIYSNCLEMDSSSASRFAWIFPCLKL